MFFRQIFNAFVVFCFLAIFTASAADTLVSPFDKNVKVTFTATNMIVESDGLPTHPTGQFPNRNNPNRILMQKYVFRVPLEPKVAAKVSPLTMSPFGIAVNGIVFDPGAAEWWRGDRSSGWQYEPLAGVINLGVDQSNAHVQPNGAYHYHGVPHALLEQISGSKEKVARVGFAADGFPIYGPWSYSEAKATNSALKKLKSSYRIKSGPRPSGPGGAYDGSFVADYEYVAGAGDLDECNGRFGITFEYPQGTYYYCLTGEFPYVPRLYKGTPDESFIRRRPPGGPGGPGGPGQFRGPPPFPPPFPPPGK